MKITTLGVSDIAELNSEEVNAFLTELENEGVRALIDSEVIEALEKAAETEDTKTVKTESESIHILAELALAANKDVKNGTAFVGGNRLASAGIGIYQVLNAAKGKNTQGYATDFVQLSGICGEHEGSEITIELSSIFVSQAKTRLFSILSDAQITENAKNTKLENNNIEEAAYKSNLTATNELYSTRILKDGNLVDALRSQPIIIGGYIVVFNNTPTTHFMFAYNVASEKENGKIYRAIDLPIKDVAILGTMDAKKLKAAIVSLVADLKALELNVPVCLTEFAGVKTKALETVK